MRYPARPVRLRMTTPDLHARWWQWPTVLSFDAPVVLVVWQGAVANTADMTLDWAPRAVLAASIWVAYTIDRWLEALRLPPSVVRTPRHAVHQRWRWPIAAATCGVFVADVAVAVLSLPGRDLAAGGVLAAAAACYVLSHQWLHRNARWRVPKEVVIAALLGGSVWLFVREGPPAVVLAATGLLSLLVLTNISLISSWEVDIDLTHGQSSLALESSAARQWIPWLPWTAAVVSAAMAMAAPAAAQPLAVCGVFSALLMGVSDRMQPYLGWPLARVASDLALLTPLVLLVS